MENGRVPALDVKALRDPFDQPLDRPEDPLDEHGLRARPAAPHAPEERGQT